MIRKNLRDLPLLIPPRDYSIRTFEPGDEHHWETIIRLSFETPRAFRTIMTEDPSFLPDRLFFAVCGGKPVATAAAWYHPLWGHEFGYLFFVAVHPEHRGKYLGYFVSLAALYRFIHEKREQAVLETDDHRIPAIKTYLRLGFAPHVTEETRGRWELINRKYRLGLRVPTAEQWRRETEF